MSKQIKSGKHVTLIVLAFAIPVFAAWLLYHFHDHFNLKTTNQGILFKPVFSVARYLPQDEGQPHWRILYFSKDCCQQNCEHMLHNLHQLRQALGKEQDRVQLTLLTQSQCNVTTYNDIQHLALSKNQMNSFNHFIAENESAAQVTDDSKIYIIDPHSNMVLYYSGQTDPMNILKDMKHLLRASQIG